MDSIKGFKVFKERCIDILSGPLHATPEENQVYYLQYWTGEEGSKLISQWTAGGKITDDDKETTSKKKLRTYWQINSNGRCTLQKFKEF